MLAVTTASWGQNVITGGNVALSGEAKGAVNPVDANIGAKNIGANYNGGWKGVRGPAENVNLKEERDRVNLVLAQRREEANAGASNGFGQANFGKDRAASTIFKDGEEVKGGLVNAGNQRGVLRSNTEGNVRHNNLNSGDLAIDTRGFNLENNGDTKFETNFTSKNGGRSEYNVDPASQTNTDGDGIVQTVTDGKKNNFYYKMKESSSGKQVIEFNDDPTRPGSFIGSSSDKWTCEIEELAPSKCVDGNGKQVGSVVYNAQGETTVYDKNGAVLTRGDARRTPNGNDDQYEVDAAGGVLKANTERLVEKDCFDDVYNKLPNDKKDARYKTQKVKVENFKIRYNVVKNRDGTEKVAFPDCFEISYDVVLPPGLSFKTMEYQLKLHIMPLGSYDCTDGGTCPRHDSSCYYCDLCKKQTRTDSLKNSKGNECDGDATGSQRIVRTICPTPAQEEFLICNGFDRSYVGNEYRNYDGQINGAIIVWDYPDRDDIRKEFLEKWNTPITGTFFQTQWKVAYANDSTYAGNDVFNLQGKGAINNFNVLNLPIEEYNVMEYYVYKKASYRLAGCTQGIADYNLGGSKVKAGALADAFVTVMNGPELIRKNKCQGYQQLQRDEYKAIEAEQKPAAAACTGIFCGTGSLLGGFGNWGRG